jgi:hypothetical protein
MRSRSFLANWGKLPVLVTASLMAAVIALTMERRTYSMTPEENQVIFQRIWAELFNQRNLAVADELFASDFVNHVRLVQVTQKATSFAIPADARFVRAAEWAGVLCSGEHLADRRCGVRGHSVTVCLVR